MVSSPAGGFGAEKAPPTSAPPSSSQPGEKNTKKPAPKKEDALREIRIGASLETPRSETPDEPGKPNIARQIFLRVTLQMALDAHKGEWAPLFQSERTQRGLRIICNERGNRYSYEIVGEKIREGEPRYTAWIVDGRLLQVRSHPLKEGERLKEDRLLREPREDFTKIGWKVVPDALKTLQFPKGEKAEYVELVPGKDATGPRDIVKVQIATTLNRRNILTVACPIRKDGDERKGAQMVRQTLLSVQRLPDLPAGKAPLTADHLLKRGLTLKEVLHVNESIMGKDWGALLNEEMATLQDRRLPRVAVLGSKEMLQNIRRILLHERLLPVAVFDGATGHAMNLIEYDRSTGRYVYWEPWGKGTFLARGNNKAGVAARQHPSHRKHFSVTEEELGKVVYAVTGSWQVLQGDRELLELLDRPEAETLAALKKIHKKDSKNPQISESHLLASGRLCLLEKQSKKAANVFRACRALYPQSLEALIGLGDVLRAEGKREEAVRAYRQALDELSGNKQLTPAKKERLEKQIRDSLSNPRTDPPRSGTLPPNDLLRQNP